MSEHKFASHPAVSLKIKLELVFRRIMNLSLYSLGLHIVEPERVRLFRSDACRRYCQLQLSVSVNPHWLSMTSPQVMRLGRAVLPDVNR